MNLHFLRPRRARPESRVDLAAARAALLSGGREPAAPAPLPDSVDLPPLEFPTMLDPALRVHIAPKRRAAA